MYLAIVEQTGGVVEKYQDYPTEAEADAHVVTYGGFVVQEPSHGLNFKYCTVDPVAKTIVYDSATQAIDQAKAVASIEIQRLESTVTPRRIREALAGQPGKDWIAGVESAIAIERGKLNG